MTELETANQRVAALEAELAAMRAVGEPVAWLDPWTGNKVTTDYDAYGKHGIPLYTHPPAAPGKPYAYAVYFPDQPTEELVHDLDDLTEDLTNREHVITKLYAQPPAAQEGKSHDQ